MWKSAGIIRTAGVAGEGWKENKQQPRTSNPQKSQISDISDLKSEIQLKSEI
jgi:hypothetical protein